MKTRLFTALISVLLLAGSFTVSAQPGSGEDWKQRMQSEKIAFLTMEIGLTPEEAQNFWPIYNQISESLDKAMFETFNSYMELEKALNDNKSDKEISKCLEKYLTALGKQDEIRENSVSQYKKILSDKKVAKIFVAEEKFRRQHIRRFREHKN